MFVENIPSTGSQRSFLGFQNEQRGDTACLWGGAHVRARVRVDVCVWGLTAVIPFQRAAALQRDIHLWGPLCWEEQPRSAAEKALFVHLCVCVRECVCVCVRVRAVCVGGDWVTGSLPY